MAEGLEEPVSRIEAIEARRELDRYHLLHAAKADAVRRLGRMAEAAAYRTALSHVTIRPSAGFWSGACANARRISRVE